MITVLEPVGLSVFATSGAPMAIEKRFDVVGILVLAVLTNARRRHPARLIIGGTPPAAFTNVNCPLIPFAAAAVTAHA